MGDSERLNIRTGGLFLHASHMRAIDEVLSRLIDSTPAELVLLIDCSGQHISHTGHASRIDLVSLGSLVAGDVAASQQIARMIGDYDDAAVLLREGLSRNVLVSEAGSKMILMMLTNKQVPIGWSRLNVFRAVRRLAEISLIMPMETRERKTSIENVDLGEVISDAVGRLWTE